MPSLHHFCSGLSRRVDFEAAVESGVTPGLQVGDFKGGLAEAVLRHVRAGGALFVDSGAFPAFSTGKKVDFDKVFRRYRQIAEAASSPARVFLVAPDKIADMEATFQLLAQYAPQIRELAALGVTWLAPLQCGDRTLLEVWAEVQRLLPGLTLIPAMPMRAAVVTIEQVIAFLRASRVKQVHLLGTSSVEFVREIDLNCHGVVVTADANRLRPAMGRGRRLTREYQHAVSEACAEGWYSGHEDVCDGTEFIYAVFNIPGTLTPAETEVLVKGIPLPADEVRAALASGTLNDLLNEDYSAQLCDHEIAAFQRERVRLKVGPGQRKAAFKRHFFRTRTNSTELYLPLFAAA